MHVTKGSKLVLFEGIQYVSASNAVELLKDTEVFTFKNDNPHFVSLFLLFIIIFNVVVCMQEK
jgi:predicted transglutaminase-like protease